MSAIRSLEKKRVVQYQTFVQSKDRNAQLDAGRPSTGSLEFLNSHCQHLVLGLPAIVKSKPVKRELSVCMDGDTPPGLQGFEFGN